jgi:hypothetical protein
MAVYVITFDLNKEKPNHAEARTQFLAHLERYENTRNSGLESVRFVSTRLTAAQLSDDLQKKLDHDDKLVVTKLVSGDYYGCLHEDVWAWISARVS